MANTVLPLSSDIYLEVDGKKVAVVQSYTTRATRTSREIEAFGENEPVATIAGANKYTLELSRLYATDDAISDGINFYDLNDFSLVICKPDKRIIYSQCRWSSIEEAGKLGDPAAEKVTIIARKLMDELLLNFLGREREKTVRIGERTCAMRLLSARETLSLRREIAQLDCADEEERALRANAALLKRSLTEGGEAAFASAEDVENALSVGEINELVRCYALLDGAENPSSEDEREKVEVLKKAWSTRPTNG